MKKVLSILLTLFLFANISLAFDPYADEEIETKSYKKLYYGIALTLLGGFLAYDGFSKEEVDVSKPSVDYTTVLHCECNQDSPNYQYRLKSGYSQYGYSIDDDDYDVCKNIIYNNGNVDLKNITIEVRYKYANNSVIEDDNPKEHTTNGKPTTDGYHVATEKNVEYIIKELKVGDKKEWSDIWGYGTTSSTPPAGQQRKENDPPDLTGLYLGKDAFTLMDIRVKLSKNKQYKPIYETRHKSDLEGVAGIMVGLAGIYFLVDHFVDMHKFNNYAKRHHLNLKLATASNEYKLMLQKRI